MKDIVLRIRTLGDPVLRERCRPVEEIDDELFDLVRRMEPVMKGAAGLGLAAPQVAVVKNMFIYDMGYGVRVMVNPRITWMSGEEIIDEGCLSIPGIYLPVPRAEKVEIKGRNLRGQLITINAERLFARVLQHEMDHLNGVLVIDRVGREERKQALERYRELQAEESDIAPLGGANWN